MSPRPNQKVPVMITKTKSPKVYSDASFYRVGNTYHIGIGVYELHSGKSCKGKVITTDPTSICDAEIIALKIAVAWADAQFGHSSKFFFVDNYRVATEDHDFMGKYKVHYVPREVNTEADKLSKEAQHTTPYTYNHTTVSKVKAIKPKIVTPKKNNTVYDPKNLSHYLMKYPIEKRIAILTAVVSNDKDRAVLTSLTTGIQIKGIRITHLSPWFKDVLCSITRSEERTASIKQMLGQSGTPVKVKQLEYILRNTFNIPE